MSRQYECTEAERCLIETTVEYRKLVRMRTEGSAQSRAKRRMNSLIDELLQNADRVISERGMMAGA